MAKVYFNNALTGNSSMLACFTDEGELVRLFWPHIDYVQHIEKFTIGIFDVKRNIGTKWFDKVEWECNQYYIKNTNILATEYKSVDNGFLIKQMDFCPEDKDILIRNYEISNIGISNTVPGIMCYFQGVTWIYNPSGLMFDYNTDSIIHYRHGYYLSITGSEEVDRFQLGENAYNNACSADLNCINEIGMMQDGAVSWELKKLKPGETANFTITVCISKEPDTLKNMVKYMKRNCTEKLYYEAEYYWKKYLKKSIIIQTGVKKYDQLFTRSILVFKLLANKKTGGIIAAPEIDEHFNKCGRYAFCWGRDAAFITGALDRSGLTDLVDKFYDWVIKTQTENGSWQQRYYTDGNMAPSWGLQIDETGTVIWGILKHYEIIRDKNFIIKLWETIKKSVNFMTAFIDSETGLPKPGFDLWEERYGEHIYSSSAVYGGISAGITIAEILGKNDELINKWFKTAENIKTAIKNNFWKEEHNCFIRSIKVKLNPWGPEPGNDTLNVKINSKGVCREVTREDWTVDASILGVTVPFEVFDVCDFKVENSVRRIETVLTSPAGGIKRYENDNYMGGNPWIITTLWVALYHIKRGNHKKAFKYLEWAAETSTSLGFFPEQADRNTGKPAWVIPLTWSHAMFVLVLTELFKEGVGLIK